MPDQITELLITEAALDKLGPRNISAEEAEHPFATITSPSATRTRRSPAADGS
jgi:hypothetical protein